MKEIRECTRVQGRAVRRWAVKAEQRQRIHGDGKAQSVFAGRTISLLRYFLYWIGNIRRGPIKALLDSFLFCIFPANACSLFVSAAHIVFLVLYLFVHVLKDVDVRLVFHGSVYTYAASCRVKNVKICPMNLAEVVVQLKNERSRLDAAIRALEGVSSASGGGMSGGGKRRGRPRGSTNKSTRAAGRRTMSAAARKRIAEAMRKRWAAAKKSGKKRL
jgi:hypothetical protein